MATLMVALQRLAHYRRVLRENPLGSLSRRAKVLSVIAGGLLLYAVLVFLGSSRSPSHGAALLLSVIAWGSWAILMRGWPAVIASAVALVGLLALSLGDDRCQEGYDSLSALVYDLPCAEPVWVWSPHLPGLGEFTAVGLFVVVTYGFIRQFLSSD